MSTGENTNTPLILPTRVWQERKARGMPGNPQRSDKSGPNISSAVAAGPEATRPFMPDGSKAATAEDARKPRVPNLQVGSYVNNRYRVTSSLNRGGESAIYLCQDEHLPQHHSDRVVVLKLYDTSLAPKQEVLNAILNVTHPNLIRVLDRGEWNGRFFEVMEYCRGGSLADTMPYQSAALIKHLGQIVEGLKYCHDQGIVHRDVKPNNLLFRDTERTALVLSDFGISSYLRTWHQGGPNRTLTSSAERHTLDYAAPELFDKGEVSPKTDYYSLGITLLHLLMGRSPFAGLTEQQVYHAHFTNHIPMPEGLDTKFATLLQGLTQYYIDNRWGYSQYRQWSDSRPVTDDQGRPWTQRPYISGIPPFPFFPSATDLPGLARSLNKFDAAERLASGHISHWVAYFDTRVADEIERLSKTVENDPALAVKKLAWLLDPNLPLQL